MTHDNTARELLDRHIAHPYTRDDSLVSRKAALAAIEEALCRPVHGLEWRDAELFFNNRAIGYVHYFPGAWCATFMEGSLGRYPDEQSAKDALMTAAKEWLQPLPAPAQPVTEGMHEWYLRYGHECCRKCGYIRNETSDRRPCKGHVKVELRAPSIEKPGGGE